ncbi:protein of unknown function [Paraburkholderia kururiensis]
MLIYKSPRYENLTLTQVYPKNYERRMGLGQKPPRHLAKSRAAGRRKSYPPRKGMRPMRRAQECG